MERAFGSLALANLGALVGASASIPVARWWITSRTATRSRTRRRVLIVGCGPVARHAALQAEDAGYEVLGFVDDPAPDPQGERPAGMIGHCVDLPDLARNLGAHWIVVAESPARHWGAIERLEREDVPAEVLIVPDAYELALCAPGSLRLGDLALIRLPRRQVQGGYYTAKRVMDLGLSLAALVLLGPLLLLAMLAVRLTSTGPALFRQERTGKHGKPFDIVKLRTMYIDAEKNGPEFWKGDNDPRQTPVGRFLRRTHLDEVPQLWNVLRGEMSLVGPRPERPVFVEEFERELPRYAERHRILPGITGLAQVNGSYHSTAREKLRYDLMYVYHPSLWLDLSILVRTALSVFH
jgi:exopolysaccharide biosynthesis polyprenyl glycosylphosphotransferase